MLSYKVRGLSVRAVVGGMWKMLLAAVVMALAMWWVTRDVASDTGWDGLAQVVVGGLVGIVVYVAFLIALRAEEMSWLQRRLGRGGGPAA